MKHFILSFSIFFIVQTVTAGEVYTWKDENGKTVFSDQPKDTKSQKVDLKSVNISDPVEVVDQPIERKEESSSTSTEYQSAPYQPSAREQQLAKEQEANEKCLRYYGYPCKAISQFQKQSQNNSGGVRPGGQRMSSGSERGSGTRSSERRQRYANQR